MSTPPDGPVAEPPPAFVDLRKQIDALLPTDAMLKSFCLDHFLEVYRQFSDEMARTAKVNLLLSMADSAVLAAQLRALSPSKPGTPNDPVHRAPPLSTPGAAGLKTAVLRNKWRVLWGGLTLLLCIVGVGVHAGWIGTKRVPSGDRQPILIVETGMHR